MGVRTTVVLLFLARANADSRLQAVDFTENVHGVYYEDEPAVMECHFCLSMEDDGDATKIHVGVSRNSGSNCGSSIITETDNLSRVYSILGEVPRIQLEEGDHKLKPEEHVFHKTSDPESTTIGYWRVEVFKYFERTIEITVSSSLGTPIQQCSPSQVTLDVSRFVNYERFKGTQHHSYSTVFSKPHRVIRELTSDRLLLIRNISGVSYAQLHTRSSVSTHSPNTNGWIKISTNDAEVSDADFLDYTPYLITVEADGVFAIDLDEEAPKILTLMNKTVSDTVEILKRDRTASPTGVVFVILRKTDADGLVTFWHIDKNLSVKELSVPRSQLVHDDDTLVDAVYDIVRNKFLLLVSTKSGFYTVWRPLVCEKDSCQLEFGTIDDEELVGLIYMGNGMGFLAWSPTKVWFSLDGMTFNLRTIVTSEIVERITTSEDSSHYMLALRDGSIWIGDAVLSWSNTEQTIKLIANKSYTASNFAHFFVGSRLKELHVAGENMTMKTIFPLENTDSAKCQYESFTIGPNNVVVIDSMEQYILKVNLTLRHKFDKGYRSHIVVYGINLNTTYYAWSSYSFDDESNTVRLEIYTQLSPEDAPKESENLASYIFSVANPSIHCEQNVQVLTMVIVPRTGACIRNSIRATWASGPSQRIQFKKMITKLDMFINPQAYGWDLKGKSAIFEELPVNYRPPSRHGIALPGTPHIYNTKIGSPEPYPTYNIPVVKGKMKRLPSTCTDIDRFSEFIKDSDCISRVERWYRSVNFEPVFEIVRNDGSKEELTLPFQLEELNDRSDWCKITGEDEICSDVLILRAGGLDKIAWKGSGLYHFHVKVVSGSACELETEFKVFIYGSGGKNLIHIVLNITFVFFGLTFWCTYAYWKRNNLL